MKTRNIKPKFSISTESGEKTRKTRGKSRKNPGKKLILNYKKTM
jgi:hypothetical protein